MWLSLSIKSFQQIFVCTTCIFVIAGSARDTKADSASLSELASVLEFTQNNADYDQFISITSPMQDQVQRFFDRSCGVFGVMPSSCPINDALIGAYLFSLDLKDPNVRSFAHALAEKFVEIQARKDRVRGYTINWDTLFTAASAAWGFYRNGLNVQDALSMVDAAVSEINYRSDVTREDQNIRTTYAEIQTMVSKTSNKYILDDRSLFDVNEMFYVSSDIRSISWDYYSRQLVKTSPSTTTLRMQITKGDGFLIAVLPEMDCVYMKRFTPELQVFVPLGTEPSSREAPRTDLTFTCSRWDLTSFYDPFEGLEPINEWPENEIKVTFATESVKGQIAVMHRKL